MVKKILLDTNFVLLPFNYRIDFFEEIRMMFDEPVEFYYLKEALSELGNVKKFKYKTIKKWLEKRGVIFVESGIPGKLDDKFLLFAKKNNMILATVDKRLRERAKKEGIMVITMTPGRRLVLI